MHPAPRLLGRRRLRLHLASHQALRRRHLHRPRLLLCHRLPRLHRRLLRPLHRLPSHRLRPFCLRCRPRLHRALRLQNTATRRSASCKCCSTSQSHRRLPPSFHRRHHPQSRHRHFLRSCWTASAGWWAVPRMRVQPCLGTAVARPAVYVHWCSARRHCERAMRAWYSQWRRRGSTPTCSPRVRRASSGSLSTSASRSQPLAPSMSPAGLAAGPPSSSLRSRPST